jgi:hypothetical protein
VLARRVIVSQAGDTIVNVRRHRIERRIELSLLVARPSVVFGQNSLREYPDIVLSIEGPERTFFSAMNLPQSHDPGFRKKVYGRDSRAAGSGTSS